MTSNNNDNLKTMLESARMEAPDNEWFTRKVMNRLPERKPQGHNWILWIIYGTVLTICLACWTVFGLKMDFGVFFKQLAEIRTTGNMPSIVLFYLGLLSTIGIAVWQIISIAVHNGRQ